jgi:hypothetical protein
MNYDDALATADKLGREAGEMAGRWVTDGTTTQQTYRWLMAGIEAGDPEVLDALPFANFSGEWADGLTENDVLNDIGLDPESDEAILWCDELIDAYSMAFSGGAQDQVAADCQYHIITDTEEC